MALRVVHTPAAMQGATIAVAAAFSEKRCATQKFIERALEFEASGSRYLEGREILYTDRATDLDGPSTRGILPNMKEVATDPSEEQ